MKTASQVTDRECGWHVTGYRAIRTLYKQIGQGFDLGLGKYCNRMDLGLVRHRYSSVGSMVLGNGGEHWDRKTWNGNRRGAAESRQKIPSPRPPESPKAERGGCANHPGWGMLSLVTNSTLCPALALSIEHREGVPSAFVVPAQPSLLSLPSQDVRDDSQGIKTGQQKGTLWFLRCKSASAPTPPSPPFSQLSWHFHLPEKPGSHSTGEKTKESSLFMGQVPPALLL